jgi:hypothetical protein
MRDLKVASGDEFVRWLSAPTYADNDSGSFLFRGQYDAAAPLLPPSLRTADPLPFGKPLSSANAQVVAEADAFVRFFDAAHYEGLRIPGDFGEIRRVVEKYRKGDYAEGWPHESTLELLAIAQHDGTPTRLLDWSRDAMVAAYFACVRGSASGAPVSDEIAVFVLDKSYRLPPDTASVDTPSGLMLSEVVIPYDLNQNARAQRGVFLPHFGNYWSPREPNTPVFRTAYDVCLETFWKIGDAITRISLPRTETPAVLRALYRRRINGASLFPGYWGVARAERERMLWDIPQRADGNTSAAE